MKIGIISDTHDDHGNVLAAIGIFNDAEVDTVLHAGDIVSPFTAKAFERLKAKHFIAVFGNNEGEKGAVRTNIESFGGEIHDPCYKGELAGKKVFMTHTQFMIPEIVASGQYDLVIYGHTHKQDIRTEDRTLVVNPGECTDWVTGQGHVVIVDTDDMSCTIVTL